MGSGQFRLGFPQTRKHTAWNWASFSSRLVGLEYTETTRWTQRQGPFQLGINHASVKEVVDILKL